MLTRRTLLATAAMTPADFDQHSEAVRHDWSPSAYATGTGGEAN